MISDPEPDAIDLKFYDGSAFSETGPHHSSPAQSPISFKRRFLVDLGAKPDTCSLVTQKGDSMLPTIPDGSLMVVDQNELEISHGCVSAFIVGKGLLVKRARWRMDGQLELVSDNTTDAYPVELIGKDRIGDLRPFGRVMYFGRKP